MERTGTGKIFRLLEEGVNELLTALKTMFLQKEAQPELRIRFTNLHTFSQSLFYDLST